MMNYLPKLDRIAVAHLLIVLSLITCFSSAPYLGHYLFGSRYILFSGALSIFLFISTLSFLGGKFDAWVKVICLFMFSFLLYGGWMMVFVESMADLRKAIGMFLKCVYVVGSCFLISRYYVVYLRYFLGVNSLIVILSVILFFLIIAGIDWEPISFVKLDGRPHYWYFPFGTTNVRMEFGDFRFIRISGYADEPGALALILTYLLIINEFSFKSNKYRIIYVLGGVFTFSMAFFITIIPILIYWLKMKVLRIRTFLCVLLVLLFSVSILSQKENFIYKGLDTLVFNRFRIDSEGDINGNNRSGAIPFQIKAFESSPFWGVGTDSDIVLRNKLDYPSFYSYAAMHGIFGYLLFYLPFIFLFCCYIRKSESLLFIALALNFLQRPSIEEMFSLICLSIIFYSKVQCSELK